MLNRMETWEHLTPEQKQWAREIHGALQQLPPERRHMVRNAVEGLERFRRSIASRSSIPSATGAIFSPRNATSCAKPRGCLWPPGESPRRRRISPVFLSFSFSGSRARWFQLSSQTKESRVRLSLRSHCPDSAGCLRWPETVLKPAAGGCCEKVRA